MQGKIEMDGYWYEYELKAAKDRVDICLATKNPKEYCNGVFLYSMKDPGSGIEFVVTDTNDPVIKAKILASQIDPEEIWESKNPRPYQTHNTEEHGK
jgi:hypothetical protein